MNDRPAWLLASAAFGLLAISASHAQEADSDSLEEILVFGRAIDLVGAADSASEGIVGYDDLTTRPLLRVGELVEVIPGMIATQHSGGGKANQYFLRGMNLDHGTDFSIHFEGMPVNMRTHAHGQGYLDMNFIIPELVQTIQYRKGTYYADVGDFSGAASSKFQTYDRLERGFLQATWGSQEYFRLVGANSWDFGNGTWLLGAEARFSDGPWENPEDVQLYNLFAKYTTELWGRDASLIGTWYSNEWNATDQIPERAVISGELDRFGFVDPTAGGDTHRFNLIGSLADENTTYQAFFSTYGLNLFSNFTYFLQDPVNGDQFEQEDARWIAGGRADSIRDLAWAGRPVLLGFGADLRFDQIDDVNLFLTGNRERLSTTRADAVDQLSVGAYAEAEITWTDRFRTTIGVRADHFRWDVTALRPENSGSGNDTIVNPKLAIAYTFSDRWEVYFNYGGGFHSNDVRGAEQSIDPVTGESVESVDALVQATGFETGFRAELSERLSFSATFFSLELDSELVFVGDAGTTEPNDASERQGVEATLFWRPSDWVSFDASAAKTDAWFRDAPPGQDYIVNANEIVASFGATLATPDGIVGSLRVRHFGDAPLSEDNVVRRDGATLLNFGLTWPFGDVILGLDVLNALDTKASDIEYFYESRLFNEPQSFEDIHFHPVESREFRLRLRYQF
jgi:outer membrane receptor protein involved in Fe transport